MERRMEEVTVLVDKGNVLISQTLWGQDNPNEIQLAPGQIDLLVSWLKEAKEEALEGQKASGR